MRSFLLLLLILTLLPARGWAFGFDHEPNDSLATATSLVAGRHRVPGLLSERRLGPGVLVRGRLEPGDVDFYRFGLRAGEVLTVAVRAEDAGAFNDPQIAIFGPDQDEPTLVNDDGGPRLLPRLSLIAEDGGTWSVAVTGFGDDDFDGTGHEEQFEYVLEIAAVRDPAWRNEAEHGGSNDSAEGAQPVFRGIRSWLPRRAAVISGSLEPGDVDQFAVRVWPGATVSASLYDLEGGAFNDSVLRLEKVDRVLAENDDGGPRLLSNIAAQADGRGRQHLRVVVTGFDYDGEDELSHAESFDYTLVIGVEPPIPWWKRWRP